MVSQLSVYLYNISKKQHINEYLIHRVKSFIAITSVLYPPPLLAFIRVQTGKLKTLYCLCMFAKYVLINITEPIVLQSPVSNIDSCEDTRTESK